MKHNLLKRIVPIIVLLVGLTSCGNLFQREAPRPGTGSLRVALRTASPGGRTILPAPVLPSDLLYDLNLSSATYPTTTFTLSGVASGALAVSGIPVGIWDLVVTGKKAGNALYQTKPNTVVTIAVGANPVTVQLEPLQTPTTGTGSLNFTLTWPSLKADTAVALWGSTTGPYPPSTVLTNVLVGFDGYVSPNTFSLSPGSGTFNIANSAIASGDYYLIIGLANGGVSGSYPVVVTEFVRIFDNQESVATVNLLGTDFSMPPPAPSGCYVTFPGDLPDFRWTDNSNTETGFRIYKGAGASTPLFSTAANVTVWSSTLSDDPMADYYIASFNAFGESARVPFVKTDILKVNFIETNHILSFGSATSIAYGGQCLIGPSNSAYLEALGGWNWYVDGIKEAETNSSFTLNPLGTLPAGQYLVSATVSDGGVLHSGSLMVTIDQDTTPKWTVSYSSQYADGGEPPIDGNVYADGATVTILGNTGNLKKTNWTLIGWTDNGAGNGTVYKSGDPYPVATNALFFYPKWVPFAGGDGTAGNPFQVSNAFQLNSVRNYLSSYFVQTANINLSGYANWVPIGSVATPFTGGYEGLSGSLTTISGLLIYRSSEDNVGLFGVANGATMGKLLLDGPSVNGQANVGSLAGLSTNTTIYQCGSGGSGSVTGTGSDVGGLVGNAVAGSISQSYSWASVSGTINLGGLVGSSSAVIGNCNAIGSVTGSGTTGDENYIAGLVGYAAGGSISDSFAAGYVTLNGMPGLAQGFAGYPGVTCTGSYFDTTYTGTTGSYGGGTGLNHAFMDYAQHPETYSTWSSTIWRFATAPGWPELQWQPAVGW